MSEFIPRSIDDVLREHVVKMLKHFGGDKSKTCRVLGITNKTLQAWLNKWSLTESYLGGRLPPE